MFGESLSIALLVLILAVAVLRPRRLPEAIVVAVVSLGATAGLLPFI